MKIDIVTINGDKKGTATLGSSKKMPGVLISNVVQANLSNKRSVIANTKDRSEVSGGGRKPWRQKGTGRARHGSNRSPIWVGGGITFGPTNARNFSKRINKKQKSLAIAHLLEQKAEDKKVIILDQLVVDGGKTKNILDILAKLGVAGKTLIIADSRYTDLSEGRDLYLATRNNKLITTIAEDKLNAFYIMKNDWIVMTEKVSEILNERLSGDTGKKEVVDGEKKTPKTKKLKS